MKKVAVLAYDGCWAMSLFSVTDFFRIVSLLERNVGRQPSYQVEVLSADGGVIRCASGHAILPNGTIEGASGHALVVIPAMEGAQLTPGFTPDLRLSTWMCARKQ